MTIEEAINTLEYIKNNPTNDVDAQLLPEAIELFDTAIDTMRKYQMLQADYEARLKADKVAMLEQLDSEIQEQIDYMGDGEEANGMKSADNLVKDKINALKHSIWQDNYNGIKEKTKEVKQ